MINEARESELEIMVVYKVLYQRCFVRGIIKKLIINMTAVVVDSRA